MFVYFLIVTESERSAGIARTNNKLGSGELMCISNLELPWNSQKQGTGAITDRGIMLSE